MTRKMIQITKERPDRPSALSRRGFLATSCGSAACALCASLCASRAAMAQAAGAQTSPAPAAARGEKARVRIVFSELAKGTPGWPNLGFDFEGQEPAVLSRLRSGCPNIEFLPAPSPRTREDTAKILAADSEVDGYVLYLLSNQSPLNAITASGRPVVVVNELYAGGLGNMRGPRVAVVSSSNFNDAIQAINGFEAMKRLNSSTILDVVNREPREAKAIEEGFGTKVQAVSADEINAAYEKADSSEGQKWAKIWMRNAAKIVEPTAEEIGKSGRMYVAMRDLLTARGAQGIAVDCLTLYYATKLPAYPCLGFCQLNNDGLVGACEADLQCAITMLAMTYLTGRPGYISDPVMDTSKNQIIYAHCVAPTKVFGPRGPANPYHIRNHSEDRKGAAIRSLMPLGQVVTSLKFIPGQKTVVMHTAKTVANIDDDKACRTKLAADIPNARKMLAGWTQGWHRVTVYGDHRDRVMNFSALLGFKVIEEG